MDNNGLDDCGCTQPCHVFLATTKNSRGENKDRRELRSEPCKIQDFKNFKFVPQTLVRRENCKGVGQNPSEDCPCLRSVDPLACTTERNINSNGCQNEFIHDNETYMEEYMKDLMTRPKEDYNIKKPIDFYKFNCWKEGGRDQWLEYPFQDYFPSTMKQVSKSTMNGQRRNPLTLMNQNLDHLMNSSQPDLRTANVCGCPIVNMSNITVSNPRHYDNFCSFSNSNPNLQSCRQPNNYNNLKTRYPMLPCTGKIFQQISLPIIHQEIDERSPPKGSPPCYGCPTQSLSFSNKTCRWGECHGPMKTKCLGDPKKWHMFMKGCQVWHCGGCCKMEREHITYKSKELLRQSDIAIKKKEQQMEFLRQKKQNEQ